MKAKPFWMLFAAGSLLFAIVGFARGSLTAPAAAATPPPPPPALGTPATPGPEATLIPLTGGSPAASPTPASAHASPSPPPGGRKGLDGVWEVQIQHPSGTDYTHFAVTQDGQALSGTYLDARGKKYPLAGTLEGQAVRLVVAMPNGTTLLLEGKLDGTTDMVGTLTAPGGVQYFTASYRPKEKWIDNVNPSPGGMGAPSGGYTPP